MENAKHWEREGSSSSRHLIPAQSYPLEGSGMGGLVKNVTAP